MSKEPIEIILTFIRATDKSLLLSDGDIEAWVPISVIEDPPLKWYEYEPDESYEFQIQEWFLTEYGFI